MTRLILTTSDSGAASLKQAGIADVVIPFGFRFVWEELPSDAKIATSLAPPRDQTSDHWLGRAYRKVLGDVSHETGFPATRSPTSGVCSSTGRSAPCWLAWLVVRCLPCQAWTQ